MLEGSGLMIAGALLLTPGFFHRHHRFPAAVPAHAAWLTGRIGAHGRFRSPVGGIRRAASRDPDVIDGVKYRRED